MRAIAIFMWADQDHVIEAKGNDMITIMQSLYQRCLQGKMFLCEAILPM